MMQSCQNLELLGSGKLWETIVCSTPVCHGTSQVFDLSELAHETEVVVLEPSEDIDRASDLHLTVKGEAFSIDCSGDP